MRAHQFSRCSAITPKTVLLIPNVILVHSSRIYDTYWIQILPWAASVFGILLSLQILSALPPEIAQVALSDDQIDAVGPIGTGLSATVIFTTMPMMILFFRLQKYSSKLSSARSRSTDGREQ